jgi:hypothetical protein
MNSIFKKSNWLVFFAAGILFSLLAAGHVFADYSGHVASFKSEGNAANFVSSMKTKGLVAYYRKENIPEKGEFFRVYIGRYKTLSLAQKSLAKLKKDGEIEFFKIERASEVEAQAAAKKIKPVTQIQKPSPQPASSIDTSSYYSGIEGIVLKNGKVIKGQIISIDENDVLRIRTTGGKILSYSFVKDIKEYILEPEP